MPITIKNNPEDAGGVNNCIVITIPARGETGWADLVRAAFKKISQHDHTGNENGAQLGVASLEDGAVTKAKINANVAGEGLTKDATSGALNVKIDDVTIERDAPTNTLRLKDDGVSAAKLNADVAGLGLVQNGVDESLEVNVDDSTIEIDTDIVRVKDLGIVTAKLADAAITTAKLFNGSVTTDKIADDAVTAAKISFISDTVASDAVQNDTLVWNATSGQFEPQAGGGGSSGGINHIPVASSDAEAFSVNSNDWTISDSASYNIGKVYFGSDSNLHPLRGDYSFSFRALPGAQTGETIDIPFTVDIADRAKKHLISFDYKPYAPLGVNNFVDDAVRISIIKTVGGVDQEIRVNGEDIKAVTHPSTHYAQFQTDPSASVSYKLRFTLKDVSATNAGSLILDNIKVSPVGVNDSVSSQDIVCNLQGLSSSKQLPDAQDTVIDTWNTPAIDTVGGWDAVNQYYVVPETGYYDIDVTIQVFDDPDPNTGAPTSDINRVILQIKQGSNIIKLGGILTSTVQYNYVHLSKTAAYLEKGQSIYFVARQDQVGTGTASVLSSSVYTNASIAKRPSLSLPESVGSGRDVFLHTQHDTSTQVANNTDVTIPWDKTNLIDTTNSLDNNGVYTVPETGYYDISTQVWLAITNDFDAPERFYSSLHIDGSLHKTGTVRAAEITNSTAYNFTSSLNSMEYLEKGQTVEIKINQTSGGNRTIIASPSYNWLTIAKRQSAQTVLDNGRDIIGSFFLSANQGINTISARKVQFDTVDIDTAGAFVPSTTTDHTTGYYEIPETGYYDVNVQCEFNNVAAGDRQKIILVKNTSTTVATTGVRSQSTSSTDTEHVALNGVFYFTKGDQIAVNADTDADNDYLIEATSSNVDTWFKIAKRK